MDFKDKTFQDIVFRFADENKAQFEYVAQYSAVWDCDILAVAMAGLRDSILARAKFRNENWTLDPNDGAYEEVGRCTRDLATYGFILDQGIPAYTAETMFVVADIANRIPQVEAPHSDEGWVEFLFQYAGWDYYTVEDLRKELEEYSRR